MNPQWRIYTVYVIVSIFVLVIFKLNLTPTIPNVKVSTLENTVPASQSVQTVSTTKNNDKFSSDDTSTVSTLENTAPDSQSLQTKGTHPLSAEFEKLFQCFDNGLKGLIPTEYWNEIPNVVTACSAIRKNMHIRSFANSDEVKFYAEPHRMLTPCTIVTLGVGHDVSAEKKMKETLNCSFVGADPADDGNKALYEEVGEFHLMAVAGQDGEFDAHVFINGGEILNRTKHVGFIPFIKDILATNFVDGLLLDAEYAEYGILPHFVNKRLDKENITICQVNVEVHLPNDEQRAQFMEWMNTILQERRWVLLDGPIIDFPHLRLFMINQESPECVEKYLF